MDSSSRRVALTALGIAGIGGFVYCRLQRRSKPAFKPEYIPPVLPIDLRIAAKLGYSVLKWLLPAPNGEALPDVSGIAPEKPFVIADGVNSLQSVMLMDPWLVGALYVPTMKANLSAAVELGESASLINDAIQLADDCAKKKLTHKDMLNEGFYLQNYMTALRLTSGRLMIFNPVRLTAVAKSWVKFLGGDVAYVVSPCSGHTLWVQNAMKEFPEAKLIAGSGAADKLKKLGLQCDFLYTDPDQLESMTRELTAEGVVPLVVHGDGRQTMFVWHSASETLLECDICYKHGWQAPAHCGLPSPTKFGRAMRATVCKCSPNGVLPTYNFACMDPSNPMYAVGPMPGDRKKMRESLENVLALPFERVISAHDGMRDKDEFVESVRQQWMDWL